MTIAVYCSASNRIPETYLKIGDTLGEWIARSGHTLLYGGATGGLMSRVSEAAKRKGGEVIGVITDRIICAGRQATHCDTLYIVETMNARKQKMKELADCFICLPGSYGTLDEMVDVIASATVGEHRKPLYIVNYQGFYESLRELITHWHSLKFLPQQESYKPIFVDSIESLYPLILSI